jgi:hypothetical protein
MTIIASHALVRARQRKARVSAVIKCNALPGCGRMTAGTGGCETANVNVLFAVARYAGCWQRYVLHIGFGMATVATGARVNAHKCEFRIPTMVKPDTVPAHW